MPFRFRETRDGYLSVSCTGCMPLVVNGIACHEQGCPDTMPGDLLLTEEVDA